MNRTFRRFMIGFLILAITAGGCCGLSFLMDREPGQNVAENDTLESETETSLGEAGEGVTTADGKQTTAVDEVGRLEPEVVEDLPSGGGYSGGGGSHGGGSHGGSSGGGSGSGGSSGGNSGGSSGGGNDLPPDEYYIGGSHDDTVYNICHSCGTRYTGTGGCPNPNCDGYHPN